MNMGCFSIYLDLYFFQNALKFSEYKVYTSFVAYL